MDTKLINQGLLDEIYKKVNHLKLETNAPSVRLRNL